MASQVVAAVLLLALVGVSTANGVFSIQSMIEPKAVCEIGTLYCSPDCLTVQMCVGNGVYVDVQECGADELCDARTTTCNSGLAQCNAVNPDEFTCMGNIGGRFPSPFDCHAYFECPTPIPFPEVLGTKQTCNPITSAYNASSGVCDLPASHRVCTEGPVPACNNIGQMGAIIENPNMYYICLPNGLVLKPFILKCDDANDVFQNGQCVTQSTTTSDPSSTSSGTETTTSGTETTTDGIRCDYPGEVRYDESDCQSYWLCTYEGFEFHFKCRQDYFFERYVNKRCIEGACPYPTDKSNM